MTVSDATQQNRKPDICVIAIGNAERGDDAAGQKVLELLKQGKGQYDALYCGGDSMTLINLWRDYRAAIIVDTSAPTGQPGRLKRYVINNDLFAALPEAPSSHMASLPEAYRLADTLGVLPEKLILFAIEGAQFDLGASLTPEVEDALPQTADAIRQEIDHLNRTPHPPMEVLHA